MNSTTTHQKPIANGDNAEISSLSFLLRVYNVPLSAQKANKILVDKGILLELYRPSLANRSEIRRFKILSKKGLQFGRNLKNPVHPLETKVYYCLNAFQTLAEILLDEAKKRKII